MPFHTGIVNSAEQAAEDLFDFFTGSPLSRKAEQEIRSGDLRGAARAQARAFRRISEPGLQVSEYPEVGRAAAYTDLYLESYRTASSLLT